MITYRSEPMTDVVEICVDGRIDAKDLAYAYQRLDNDIARCGQMKVLEVIESVDGVEPKALWDDLVHAPKILPHVSKAAVVTDAGFVRTLSKAADPLLKAEVKTFRRSELDEARAWIAQG